MDCLEEELTCAICYSIFVDPRVLTCSHTFCRNCLKGLIEQLDNFSLWRRLKCPSCRTLVEIPAAGAESLPINFALKAVIEKWQQEGPSGVPTCPEHHKQPLNIYCLLDRKLVCGQCLTIGQHHGHPIDDLQSAYLKAKETCGKLQEELRDRHWKHVFLRYMLLKERKCQCQTAVLGEKEVVVQYFKKLSDTLELKKQALLTALDELNSHIMEEYEPLIEQVQNMKLEQIKLYSLSLALLKEESPLAFLEGLERLQQRLQALRQKELPAVKSLEIYPRMRNVLEDLWAKTKISQISDIFTPTLTLIPQRKTCSKCPGKNVRGSKRVPQVQLKAVNLPAVLLLCVVLTVTVYSLHKAVSAGAIRAAPAWIWEFLLHVYEHSCTSWQKAVGRLCHTFTSLMGFCRRIVPFDYFNN